MMRISIYFYEGNDLICKQDRWTQVQGDDTYHEKYFLTDHLGSTRSELEFDTNGDPNITENHDLMPYGEEINLPEPDIEQIKFTGKIRDAESGLDNFGNRFFSNIKLRWNSPDYLFADNKQSDPSGWNLYLYVNDNPICLYRIFRRHICVTY